MANTKLTRLVQRPMGMHDITKAYEVLDLVMSEDGLQSFLAVKNVPAGTPLSNAAYWKLNTDITSMRSDIYDHMLDIVHGLSDPWERTAPVVAHEAVGGIPFDKLETDMRPIQEGSGDPHYAGGGKNLLPPYALNTTLNGITAVRNADGSVKISGTAAAVTTLYLADAANALVFPAGTYTASVGGAIPDGVSVVCQYYNGTSWGGHYANLLVATGKNTFTIIADTNFVMYVQVRSGATVDYTMYPQLEAGNTATAYTAYENIRPFVGRTSAKLTRCGKNLIDMSKLYSASSGMTCTIRDNVIHCKSNTAGTYHAAKTNNFLLRGGVTYTLSAKVTEKVGEQARVGFRRAKAYPDGGVNSFISSTSLKDSGNGSNLGVGEYSITFTLENDTLVYLSLMVTWNTDALGEATFADIQLEVSGAASVYEEYKSDDVTFKFGQTLYGGKVDWNTGLVKVDRKLYTFTGTESQIFKLSDTAIQQKSSLFSFTGLTDTVYGYGTSVCSHFKNNGTNHIAGAVWDGSVGIYCDSNPASETVAWYKYFRWGTGASTVNEFKAFLAAQYAAGTPVQICYTLAEPIEIQLTAPHLLALSGVNTVSTDGEKDIQTAAGRVSKASNLLPRIEALETAILNNA